MLKGGQVLDALASCHSIAFDKTGTLTTGEFMCKAIEPIHGHGKRIASCCVPSCEKEALAVAAAMERGTTHPIGRWCELICLDIYVFNLFIYLICFYI